MSGNDQRAFHCPACRLRDPKHDKPLCKSCWIKVSYETQQLWWSTLALLRHTQRGRIDLELARRTDLIAVLKKAVGEAQASTAVAS